MLRLAIIALSVVFIAIIAGLASIPLLIRDPLPVVGPRAPVSFQYRQGEVTTAARLRVDTARRFLLVLVSDADRASEAPTLAFTMPGHDMPALVPDVDVISGNRFRAAGVFPVPGRWQVSIRQGEYQRSFQFIVGE